MLHFFHQFIRNSQGPIPLIPSRGYFFITFNLSNKNSILLNCYREHYCVQTFANIERNEVVQTNKSTWQIKAQMLVMVLGGTYRKTYKRDSHVYIGSVNCVLYFCHISPSESLILI